METLSSSASNKGFFTDLNDINVNELLFNSIKDSRSPNEIPDFSPFNFRFSSITSPKLNKRNNLIINSIPEKHPEFKIKPMKDTPHWRKENIKKEEKQIKEDTKDLFLSETNFPENNEIDSFSMSQNMDINKLFDDIKEDKYDKYPPKLLRLNRVYDFITTKFIDGNLSEAGKYLEENTEFQILAKVAKILGLQNLINKKLPLQEKVIEIFKTDPTRKKQRARIIQTIFTTIHNFLELKNGVGRAEVRNTSKNYIEFYKKYFGDLVNKKEDSYKIYDYRKFLTKNSNLSLDIIKKILKCERYKNEFITILENEFFQIYKIYSFRKISIFCSKIEHELLNSSFPLLFKEYLDKIHLSLPYTKFELKPYLNFFY